MNENKNKNIILQKVDKLTEKLQSIYNRKA